MEATALICDEQRRFSLQPVALPEPGPGDIVVRTLCSGVSIGTEFALIRNKISWGPFPLCTGYMAVGEVEGVGAEVEGFAVGDRVYYRANAGMALADGTAVSAVSGTHASRAVMNPGGTHGAALLPADAPAEAAAMFVLPAVGLAGVTMAGPGAGDGALVYGAGLIGLGVVWALAALGCVVTAVDPDPAARDRALAFGADFALPPDKDALAAHFTRLGQPEGMADITFECTGIPACIGPAIEATRVDGVFVWQGNYGVAPFPFSFLPAHGRRLTMYFPCDDGGPACRSAVVRQMARGILPWDKAITDRVAAAAAPAIFAAIERGERGHAGVVIRWGD